MDARELKRRAGIITEGVDVDSVSAELARANKQELASILSKAAATSSDLYGDAVIVQAFQAAIDQLSGGGLYEEETGNEMPKTIEILYRSYGGRTMIKGVYFDGKQVDTQAAEQKIRSITGNKRDGVPVFYSEQYLDDLKQRLAPKGVNLIHQDPRDTD